MARSSTAFFLAVSALLAAGCGQSAGTGESGASNPGARPGPEAAVTQFLEHVRAGDEAKASLLLTPLAKEKTSALGLSVGLPCTKDASFKVGDVELVGEDGAHVASEWTDVEEGEKHTDTIVWILRKEADGWRVAGMATKVFENELPVILNFEDPEDMLRKQKMADEELSRRAEQENLQASEVKAADPAKKR